MTQNELNQTGYIIEGFRATPITYGDYLREYWSDETTSPNGIAPRYHVRAVSRSAVYGIAECVGSWDTYEDALEAAEDGGYSADRIMSSEDDELFDYQIWSYGLCGNHPSYTGEVYDTEDAAKLAIYDHWQGAYYNESTDNPLFISSLEEAAETLAETTNRPIAVIHRYWALCAIADTRKEEARKLSDLKKEVLKHAIEVEAAELVPDSILFEDLRASNDLKGEERTKARSAAQVAFLLRVNHYPIRTDFWKVFKIVNAKKL